MAQELRTAPVVVSFSGLDPSGHAGMAADITALSTLGCHPAPVMTVSTVQNRNRFVAMCGVDVKHLRQQAELIFSEMDVAAIKIGIVGSVEVVEFISQLCAAYPHVPVVLDPVLLSTSGGVVANEDVIAALKNQLFKYVTVLTPNAAELCLLTHQPAVSDSAIAGLLGLGCQSVLVTSMQDEGVEVINTLFCAEGDNKAFHWPKLKGEFRGSGCILSAAIAAFLARGLALQQAVEQAQQYTWNTLQQAYFLDVDQWLPDRAQVTQSQ